MNATSIKQLIQQIVQPQMPTVVEGVVLSTEPLRITMLNEMKVTVHSVSLTVPSCLQPLAVGDRLYLLTFGNGKMNYVLDRV